MEDQKTSIEYKITILWHQVFLFSFFHVVALHGIYVCFTATSWKTILFAFAFARVALVVASAGMHRLWSHRSYKAKLPLRIFLCMFVFVLGQNNILKWCRDHRVHHRYVDTDADPYNIKRGFFFAHIGWILCKKHPAVFEAGAKLPMDDLLADPVVRFNIKYYYPMWILLCFIVPTFIPVYFWDENLVDAFCVAGALRYVFQLHCTFCTNSVAHTFGYRPFDKNQEARESYVTSYLQPGEGSHNYHHVFPGDYRTKEHGLSFNSSRLFIELMASIGQAHDLKLSSDEAVQTRRLKANSTKTG